MVTMRELINIVAEAPGSPKGPVPPVPAKVPTPPVPPRPPKAPVTSAIAKAPLPRRKPLTPDMQANLDQDIAARLSDIDAVNPQSFIGQVTARDAERIEFDSPAAREIKAKVSSTPQAPAHLTPQQKVQYNRQMKQAEKEMRGELGPVTPLTPEKQAELEKFAK